MAQVVLTGPAQRDIRASYEWWRDNRSREQAERWYRGILAAARSLSRHPERCGPATESDLLPQGIRRSGRSAAGPRTALGIANWVGREALVNPASTHGPRIGSERP